MNDGDVPILMRPLSTSGVRSGDSDATDLLLVGIVGAA